ncbi:MAG TPA: aminoglycoside phosphotransferase family protein [Vicinamibacterales bacterium]
MTILPDRLANTCRDNPERAAWLERLPKTIAEIVAQWSLSIGPPYEQASCAWVAPATRKDGARVVLKLGMPHMEGRDEIRGLQLWAGDPTVRLLDSDSDLNALLLERCEPGTTLRELAEAEQDVVLAGLLHRLWRRPPARHAFRPLSLMIAAWMEETLSARAKWRDEDLVRAGLRTFETLKDTADDDVLLATDLHAGNVLRATREPWLVIDPKPFVGDRAYDATQHIFNCKARVLAAPRATIQCLADLLHVDSERVRLWTFARSAAEPRETWTDDSHAIARALV